MQQFGVGRDTARRATRHLRDKLRLVYTVPARGTFVRPHGDKDPDVILTPRADLVITCRMPTPVEAAELSIPENVPVTVVSIGDAVQLYPAGTLIRFSPIS